ncbi:MAG TPA: hypothetical protein VG148_10540 [Pyrinomonadaceae bacterium]|nr:hypothetical protein [Pyrinomonadaceae bacterium]
MRNYFQSVIRGPWAPVWATLLLCYALVPFTYDGEFDFYALARLADLAAVLISFPLGLLAALGLDQLTHGFIHRSQFWALCLACGYFQWLHLVPLLRRRRRARTSILNLADDEQVAPADTQARPAEPPPAQLAAAHAQLMPQFNEFGRTPLERVFDRTS